MPVKGNRLSFGYGDIIVNAIPDAMSVQFKTINCEMVIGHSLKELEPSSVEITKIDTIKYTEQEARDLIRILDLVLEVDFNVFYFNGIVYDFSNYNPDSVWVVKNAIQTLLGFNDLTIAC